MKTSILILALAFTAAAGRARAADAVDQLVSESTGTPKRTAADLYRGDRYRDPFAVLSPGRSAAVREAKEFSLETFSIHALKLKGIMREKAATYAILVDRDSGMGFLLRGNRLFTYKNEMIPGVSGRINAAQKSVTLVTAEKDVQTLRLGEEEDGDGAEKEAKE